QVNLIESTTVNTSISMEYTPIEPTTINTSTSMEYTPTTVNTSMEYTPIESTTNTSIESTFIPSILIANPHNLTTSTSDPAISSTNSNNPASTIANPSSPAIPTAINTSNASNSEILANLITPIEEISRVSSSSEEENSGNITLSLVQLYNKAERSQKRAILANQAEI
ncbi:19612_t:CDS:2, partial [Dentiscutata erythropus]